MSARVSRPIAVLNHQDFVYCRMKALIWAANGTFLPTLVQRNAGEMLATLLSSEKDGKPLIVNCQGVLNVDDHSVGPLNEALKLAHRQLVFTNAKPIEPLLTRYIESPRSSHSKDGDCTIQFGHNAINLEGLEKLLSGVAPLERSEVSRLVKESFKPFEDGPQRLTSTPILATGVFNARRLISNPQSFIWICLLLSERLEGLLQKQLLDPPDAVRLLAVSLRGSPFAAALGALNSLPIEIVDHLGPKHRILEEYTLRRRDSRLTYIYVGDFVIGGSELRVAEAYANATGCSLKHALVIGTLLPPTAYSLGDKLAALIPLREVDPNVKYQVFSETE